jgi:protein TonB
MKSVIKRKFILSILLLANNFLFAQTQNKKETMQAPSVAVEEAPQDETFVFVEQMPEFPGGQKALMQYLSSNIKYPEECRKMGVEGKVFVKFIVDKTGSIINTQILRGVADGKLLEKEALRVIQAMPKWTPGKQSGKVVDVYFTLPISFKLSNISEEQK